MTILTDRTARTPTVGVKLTTTASTTVYVSRETKSKIIEIWIANVTGSAATVTVEWYVSRTAVAYTLCFQKSVPANDFLQLQPQALGLSESDEVRVTAGTANALHVTLTPVEVSGRNAAAE